MAQILLADDSRAIRTLVKGELEAAGHEVFEAEHGKDAFEIAKSRALDLVLTDLNMPVMNGIELTRCIRSLPSQQTTPIMLVTTDSQLSKKNQAKEAGATGWIVKPVPPKKLLQVVSKVLAKQVTA